MLLSVRDKPPSKKNRGYKIVSMYVSFFFEGQERSILMDSPITLEKIRQAALVRNWVRLRVCRMNFVFQLLSSRLFLIMRSWMKSVT